ncbi:glycoside hydrolase superfamily [Aspergillus insuetus]
MRRTLDEPSIFLCIALLPALSAITAAVEYIDWSTYKANGVNLGGWLVQELFIDPPGGQQIRNAQLPPTNGHFVQTSAAPVVVSSSNGTLHGSQHMTRQIARSQRKYLADPTNYAAWVEVPGSKLYSGKQVDYLRKIATYAIEKYQMHVIIDLHALPGGTNGMGHGEAEGHCGWFQNQTAFDYSLAAMDAVLEYIQQSGHPESYTIEPINEPVDNRDISTFCSPLPIRCRSNLGASVNPKIPIMFQGGLLNTTYWSFKLNPSANLVFDVHNSYFIGRNAASHNETSYICSDAETSRDPIFPVFVGEWSIEAEHQNRLEGRELALNTGLYTFSKHTRGSAYWMAKCFGAAAVDDEGGMLNPDEAANICAE